MIAGDVAIVAAIGVALVALLAFIAGYSIGKSVGLVEEYRDEEKSEDAAR